METSVSAKQLALPIRHSCSHLVVPKPAAFLHDVGRLEKTLVWFAIKLRIFFLRKLAESIRAKVRINHCQTLQKKLL